MRRLLALIAVHSVACVAAHGPQTPATPTAVSTIPRSDPAANAPGRYLPLFDRLVAQIQRQHVFAPSYEQVMGGSFADVVVPRLRTQMAAAPDRRQAMVVIAKLQNSLRDGHCGYHPPGDVDPRPLSLGISLHATVAAERGVSTPILRVAKHQPGRDSSSIPVGSRLTAIDGVAVGEWLAAHPFETNMLVPAIALQRTANSVVVGLDANTGLEPGAPRTLAFVRPDGAPGQTTLQFAELGDTSSDEPNLDRPPPTDDIDCDASRPAPYGDDYVLTATGVFLCVYSPRRGPRVPIVRYLSFFYADGHRDQAAILRQIKIDHDILKKTLVGAKGVILDLHENHGGNNPFIFYRWFARKPWTHEIVRTLVVPEFTEETVRDMFAEPEANAYLAAQKRGDPSIASRFLCLPPQDPRAEPRCDDVPPIPRKQVTTAKIAVIVGPSCVSSCDTFALSWAHFGEGPIVGRQPAHAYTVYRHQFPLAGPDGEDLGQFCVGLSSSHLGSERAIEGEPIKLAAEIPDRFDNRDTWVREAVAEATKQLLTQ